MSEFNFTPHEKECAQIVDQLTPILAESGLHVGPHLFKALTLRLAEFLPRHDENEQPTKG